MNAFFENDNILGPDSMENHNKSPAGKSATGDFGLPISHWFFNNHRKAIVAVVIG